jgi:hypothetical protein
MNKPYERPDHSLWPTFRPLHARAQVLGAAYATHPKRFVRKHPEPPALPGPAGINKPTEEQETSTTINSTKQ